jgi:hypothetical protein
MGNWKEYKKAKKETNKAMRNGELRLFFRPWMEKKLFISFLEVEKERLETWTK